MRKSVLIILSVIAGILLLFYGGCRLLVHQIVSHKTCERYNIDNYEIRTHTDIPKTKDVTCYFDTSTQTKSSVFVLDLTQEELTRSIEYNKLKRATVSSLPSFKHNPAWNDSIAQLPIEHLYAKTGSYKNDSWVYVLDSVNQTFWAELTEEVQ